MATFNFPITITTAGLQPQSPASLLAQLLAAVAATNPGYTGDLPASLIEDVSSTDVGAIVLIDQARVELVNSLTPYGANAFVLNQLGAVYGLTPGLASNTSVNVIFTGTVGYVISVGFQISDGTHIYQIQDGGVIGSDGNSESLTAIATQQGSWVVPPSTVTQIVTSVPGAVTLSVTNPLSGTPGGSAETEESFRARVLQAGLAATQGMPRYLKTQLQNLPGVVSRLVGIIVTLGTGIEVLCGGSDNYEIANAIFNSVFDPSALIGSTTHVAIANPTDAAVGTETPGGTLAGRVYYMKYTYVNATGETLPSPEGGPFAIDLDNLAVFTSPAASTGAVGWNAYVTGGGSNTETLQASNIAIGTDWTEPLTGLITGASPPATNTTYNATVTVTLNNYPDNYDIIFVSPIEQVVTISLTWNTNLSSFAQADAVNQIAVQPIADYINSIGVGAPINLLELNNAFAVAVSSILDLSNIDKLDWTITVNGNPVSPDAGETIIESDPESYFSIQNTDITVTQG
jgi:Baseplate J-like protein